MTCYGKIYTRKEPERTTWPAGVMVAASTWRPWQPSTEGTNATDQTSTAPAARTPGPAREMVRQPFFSKEGDASPAAASLLILLVGDVETNPGPSCYAVRLQRMQHRLPMHLLRPLPRRSQHRYRHIPLGVPSVPCHCCTCTRLPSSKPFCC